MYDVGNGLCPHKARLQPILHRILGHRQYSDVCRDALHSQRHYDACRAFRREEKADAPPEKQLARGYSITLKNGKAIKNASLLNEGDEIITRLYKGEVVSVVTNKLSKNK